MVMRRLIPAIAGTAITLVALVGSPASAHVEPSVQEVPAGSWATVDFAVEHGCEGSPTVKLEFQLPATLTDVTPVDQEGWTASVDGDVVTFAGGPLPADQEAEFAVQFTVPDEQGTELVFPFIQTCQEGSIDWVQTGEESERPAPVVVIGAPDPSAPTTPTTAAATTEATEPATTEPATTQAIAPVGETTADDTEETSDEGANPWLAVVGVVVVTAAVVGGVIFLRGRSS